MDTRKDYYKILGITENASAEEIKKAYRKLAKEYHPDKRSGDTKAEERFKNISEAYSVLNNPKRRQEYDAMRRNPFSGSGGGFGQGQYDFSGPGGFRVNFGGSEGGFGDIDDLLGNLFGFGGTRRRGSHFGEDYFNQRRRRPQKGADIQAEITIPFELAALGGETVVKTPTGKSVKLKIPSGTEHGKKMKISGQGSTSPSGGPAGDLYINIRIAPHPKFERKGNDIYSTDEINIAEAVLGTEINVNTIENKKIKLKIPAGTGSAKVFRLANLGIKSVNGRGDHFVRIQIKTPNNLSNSSLKTFREWAKKNGLIS